MPKRDPWELIRESFAIEAQEAQEAGTLAYMARVFAQTSMPYRDPGDLPAWTRSNGAVTLMMQPAIRRTKGGGHQLVYPYGTIPRLLMAWVSTEAVRTKDRELFLGHNLSEFMSQLGLVPTGGRWGTVTRLRDQTHRLFGASITATWELGNDDAGRAGGERMDVAQRWQLWWDTREPSTPGLLRSTVTIAEAFFEQLLSRPVPIDMRAMLALRGSAMRLDIYAWLTYRMSYLRKRCEIPWERLRLQFGSTFEDTKQGRYNFRRDFESHLLQVLVVYSAANVEVCERGLVLLPSRPHVRRRQTQ
jgi:hypothetical protein